MIVPQLACLASYIVIYRLFRRIEGECAARWALLVFTFYPFSFFQSAGYPESMMILFTATAISLAYSNRHIAAGVALSAALMSRHLGMIAGASLLALHILQRGFRPKALLWTPKIIGLAIPCLVLGAWSWYCAHEFGDPFAFVHGRTEGWGDIAWTGVREAFRSDDHRIKVWFYVSLIPALGTLALLGRRRWWGLAPFALILMGVMYSVGAAGLGRYSASCWVAFLPIGAWLSRRPKLGPAALASLAMVHGVWLYLYAHQFMVL
jgi:hypothetical protein